MATSAHGLTFSFGGTELVITNVNVQENADVIDTSDLSLANGERRTFITGLRDAEVTVDYLSTAVLNSGDTGALAITGPFSYSGSGTITSASIGGAVGDLVKGTATFKVS